MTWDLHSGVQEQRQYGSERDMSLVCLRECVRAKNSGNEGQSVESQICHGKELSVMTSHLRIICKMLELEGALLREGSKLPAWVE